MTTYTLESPPEGLTERRKTATVWAIWIEEPFWVVTQEGPMFISPSTTEDWEDGYYLIYPTDGSKPYSMSWSFMRDNYMKVST